MANENNKINCSTIVAECTSEEISTARINGKNFWRFEFCVLKDEARELVFNTLIKLSGYNFVEYGVHLGEEVLVNPNEVWTMDTIEQCLNNNLGYTEPNRIKLNLKK